MGLLYHINSAFSIVSSLLFTSYVHQCL